MVDMGLLILRVVVGALLAGHGMQKLARVLGGTGVEEHTRFLASLGYPESRKLARFHGIAELAAGLMLAIGFLVPLAAATVIAVMLNAAVAAHGSNGLWVQHGGYEYPLVLAVVAITTTLAGPGAFAVDPALGWTLEGGLWTVVAVIGGLATGFAALGVRARTSRQGQGSRQQPAAA